MNHPLRPPTCKDCPRRIEPPKTLCVGCAARYAYTGPLPETPICEPVERI